MLCSNVLFSGLELAVSLHLHPMIKTVKVKQSKPIDLYSTLL